MNTVKLVDLKTIYDAPTLGKPMTPGNWVGREMKCIPVTMLSMSCGGGTGGSHWYEYIERIPLEDLCNGNRIVVKTWDGKSKLINLNNVVTAEQLTIATAVYNSKNPNFEQGEYLVAKLTRDNHKIKLVDSFSR